MRVDKDVLTCVDFLPDAPHWKLCFPI